MRLNHSPGSLYRRSVFCNNFLNCAVLFALLIGASHTQAQNTCTMASFAPVVSYPGNGNYLTSVTSGDFNLDGKPDLAIAFDLAHDDIGVLLGKDDGSFDNIVKHHSGGVGGVSSIAISDFNSDNKADLVVASYGGTIGVLAGNGSGGFAEAITFSSGGYSPRSLAIADFNGDGKPDVAVAHFGVFPDYPGSVTVLLGKDDGSLEDAVVFSSGGRGAQSIAAGDFNKDGKPDLAVTNYHEGTIGTLLGKGHGSFAKAVTFPTKGTGGRSIAIGDFDRDGDLDLAIAHVLTGGLSLLTGDGTGSFAAEVVDPGEGISLQSVAAGDVNGDGKLDLVTANDYLFTRDSLAVRLGKGTGSFAKAIAFPVDGQNPNAIALADFNRDGKPDVVTANYFIDATVDVLLNNCGRPAAIAGFTLVNAAAEQDIQPLKDDDVLDLSLLPRATLNIRANTSPVKVGSVFFDLSGEQARKWTENGPPYALFGDVGGNYFGGTLPEGDYTLTAIPYTGANRKGEKGTPLTIHFKVVYPAAVASFTLVNAETGEDIQELKEGDVLNLATLPSQKLNIRANTLPDTAGSVVFDLSGQQVHHQTENLFPYALLGGNPYNAWVPQAGDYTLTATPYSAPKGGGAKGKGQTIGFTIINSTPCIAPCFTSTATARVGQNSLPAGAEQSQSSLNAFPSPFANIVRIRYTLPMDARVSIKLYDVLGREAGTVFSGQRSAGTYTLEYNTGKLSQGVYYLHMAGIAKRKDIVQTLKLVKTN
jgi:hypothetical protein